jgi:isopenicillin-N epimerase
MTDLKDLFLLDRAIVFLNHGSFGATPRPVFEAYQEWQRKLENQPVAFLGRELMGYLERAREPLAHYLHVPFEDIAYIPNVTYGVNIAARSLDLKPGDEILSTDHEYGACENVWEFVCQKTGATFVRKQFSLPIQSEESFIDEYWTGVSPRTKVIYMSHITSPTAMRFPVAAICRKAREVGILTIIDGAHAPGQISVDISEIDPDVYIGNCHKWMMAPKGAGFLYVRADKKHLVEPLIVSWGWGKDFPFTTGSKFLDNLQRSGTIDPSAYLAVPAAILFQADFDWPSVRNRCHDLLVEAVDRLSEFTGLPSPYRNVTDYHQMAIIPLPPVDDLAQFQSRLYGEYQVEIPCITWQNQQFIRVSVQGYNDQGDINMLINALHDLLPRGGIG